MRGPEGPVRGGVTRCGRPPPHLRGRGRGKTSRLFTLSRGYHPWTIVTNDRLSSTMLTSNVLTLSDILRRSTSGAFGRERTVTRNGGALSRSGYIYRETRMFVGGKGDRAVSVVTKVLAEEQVTEVTKIERERLSYNAATEQTDRKSVWRRSSCSSDSCADIGAPSGLRLSRVARSTAPGRSGRGTALCAASKPGRRPPSRLTTVYRTPRRPSVRCDTCHRSPRPRGAVPNWRTPCHPRAPKNHRNRIPVSHGSDEPTSRG